MEQLVPKMTRRAFLGLKEGSQGTEHKQEFQEDPDLARERIVLELQARVRFENGRRLAQEPRCLMDP